MQELSYADSYGISIQLAFLSGPVGTSKRAQIGVGFAEVINLIA